MTLGIISLLELYYWYVFSHPDIESLKKALRIVYEIMGSSINSNITLIEYIK